MWLLTVAFACLCHVQHADDFMSGALRWSWIAQASGYDGYHHTTYRNSIGIMQHHIILYTSRNHLVDTYLEFILGITHTHIYIYITYQYISLRIILSSNLQIHHPSNSKHSRKAAAVSWPHGVIAQCHLLSRLSRCFRARLWLFLVAILW